MCTQDHTIDSPAWCMRN